ncbi:DNA adenine methylase [Peptoniphilus olsenii]|uniref:Site-specific DNA-methyltransferase (adenine-specific) n=1 Tax=Peptoniphilus olsenii TaxID=411570 RepID=A0ABV2JAJ4_9FIRM
MNILKENKLMPFTKWTGGKRQLLKDLTRYLPKEFNRYFEPFIGGGALFFHLTPSVATINDMNEDLILSYRQIRDDVDNLIELLEKHSKNNSKEYFLDIRKVDRDGRIKEMSDTEKAARLLYMLRVDFNGLYRVNKKGQFNVPYGRYKNPKIVNETLLRNISFYLNSNEIDILNTDFEEAILEASFNDFVYIDPPYAPISATSAFTAYTHDGFNESDQIRLRDTFKKLSDKGVKVMLSNSDVGAIRDLYCNLPGVNIEVVRARRNINSRADGRGKINELIIRNYCE